MGEPTVFSMAVAESMEYLEQNQNAALWNAAIRAAKGCVVAKAEATLDNLDALFISEVR